MINVTELSHNQIIKKLYVVFTYLCAPIPDAVYLKIMYRIRTGEKLHLDNPKTFNEKTQWLKINDRKPIYTTMVDKYAVKKYVADIIGEEYVIPTLGVWDKFDDIDFDMLPEQFVLKCTHDSGGLIIVGDKSKLDIGTARKKINASMQRNYFYHGREWPYKKVKRRIIAETYMTDENKQINDYKLFVFEGKVKCIQVDYDRFANHRRNFYDPKWNYMPFTTLYKTDPTHYIEKPECLEELILCAERIAEALGSLHFVRVDFYIISNRIYFGEITFYHGNGFEEFRPVEYDRKLGDWMVL